MKGIAQNIVRGYCFSILTHSVSSFRWYIEIINKRKDSCFKIKK